MAMHFGAVPVTVSANGSDTARARERMGRVMKLEDGMARAMLPGKDSAMLPERVPSAPVTRLEAVVSVLDTARETVLDKDSVTQPGMVPVKVLCLHG